MTKFLLGTIINNYSYKYYHAAVPDDDYYKSILSCLQGARHSFGTAVGKNIANPTAVLLAGCNMLRHLCLDYHAKQVEDAVLKVIKAGKVNCLLPELS